MCLRSTFDRLAEFIYERLVFEHPEIKEHPARETFVRRMRRGGRDVLDTARRRGRFLVLV